MAMHQNRPNASETFLESQRLTKELLRTAGLETLKAGCVKLNIVDFQLQEIVVQPAETRVRLHRVE